MFNSKFTNIVKDIYKNTGVAVSIYKDGGVLVCSSKHVVSLNQSNVCTKEIQYLDTKYQVVADTADKNIFSLIIMLITSKYDENDGTFASVLRGECTLDTNVKYSDITELSQGYTVFLIKTHLDVDVNMYEYLQSMASFNRDIYLPLGENLTLYLKLAGIDEYDITPKEFANVIVDGLNREFAQKCVISVGYTVYNYIECLGAVSYCKQAFEDAIASSSTKSVITTAEFFAKKIISDPTSARQTLDRYLSSGILAVINDNTLNNTALTFISNSLNFSKTARDMYIHRNTLISRIRKIEKICGLDIRNFDEAMSYVLLSELTRNIKENH